MLCCYELHSDTFQNTMHEMEFAKLEAFASFLSRATSRPSHKVSPHKLNPLISWLWDAHCTCSRFVLADEKYSSMCVCQYPDWIFHMRARRWPLTFDLYGVRVSVESLRFSRPLQVNIISNTFQDPAPAARAVCVCVRARHSASRDNNTKPLWIRPLTPTPVTEKMMKIPSQPLLFSASPSVFLRHREKRGRNNEKNISGITHWILDSHLTRSRNVNSSRTSQTFHWNIRNIPMEYQEHFTGSTLSSPQHFPPKHHQDFIGKLVFHMRITLSKWTKLSYTHVYLSM